MEPNDANWPVGATGRTLITLRESPRAMARVLRDSAGLEAASSLDFGADFDAASLGAGAVVYERVGVAVVEADADQWSALKRAAFDESNPVLAVEAEQYGHALADLVGVAFAAGYSDNAYNTWGLQATRAAASSVWADDIRVAVLDSGFDLAHPDFRGRAPITASFVPGDPDPRDSYGHGTHVTGTCCGPRRVEANRAYGIANSARLLVGKVLNDQGYYQDGWISAGIEWALAQRADIISLSLGSVVHRGGGYMQAHEQAAARALAAGCLVIAAAGNRRNEPVWSPANCPSVLAVGAVDKNLRLADFSCIGLNPGGGEIDLVAPGVDVFSSLPMGTRTGFKEGTSMAAPHVAGCAALWAQFTGLRGRALWQQLLDSARPLGLPRQVAGAGLVQAP